MLFQQGTAAYPLSWHLALSHQGRMETEEQGLHPGPLQLGGSGGSERKYPENGLPAT